MKIKLEDNQQDFLELTINGDNTISGYSPMFSHGRLSIIGIGTLDGIEYKNINEARNELVEKKLKFESKDIFVYMKETGKSDPLPWQAMTLKHRVEKITM